VRFSLSTLIDVATRVPDPEADGRLKRVRYAQIGPRYYGFSHASRRTF